LLKELFTKGTVEFSWFFFFQMQSEEAEGAPSQIHDNRVLKIQQITGRKDSLKLLEPFLSPESPQQALEFKENIERSDKMKRVFGVRPDAKQIQNEQNNE